MIENNRNDELSIQVNSGDSENCLVNHQVNKFKIKPNKKKLSVVLVPKNDKKNWIAKIALNLLE